MPRKRITPDGTGNTPAPANQRAANSVPSSFIDPRPKRPKVDWEEAERLYVKEQWNFTRIGRLIGYSAKRVRQVLAERGVPSRFATQKLDPLSTRLRLQWVQMRARCRNKRNRRYGSAGAIGVNVCAEWDRFEVFRDWALARGFQIGLVVTRIDPLSDYSPENCEMTSHKEVLRSFEIKAFGESKSAALWSLDPRCVISRRGLLARLKSGMAPEAAITQPPAERIEKARNTRMSRPDRSRIDWDLARKYYERDGWSVIRIAKALGCEHTTIAEQLRRRGVKMRHTDWTTSERTRALRFLWRRIENERAQYRKHPLPQDRSIPVAERKSVQIDPRWRRFEDFMTWALESGWKPGLNLGRLDREKGFTPENCRWMTKSELARSKRPPASTPSPKILVTAFGETKGVTEWSRDRRCAVGLFALLSRLRGGLHPEAALTNPPQNSGQAGRYRRFLEAFGESKSLREWLDDPRCRILATGLTLRLKDGWDVEAALTTPPFGRRPNASRP